MRVKVLVLSTAVLLAVFAAPMFFSMSGLVGFEYRGAEESPVYLSLVVATFIVLMAVFISSYKRKTTLGGAETGLYLFFFLLLSNHLAWVLFDSRDTQLWSENLIIFLSIGVKGFMAARVIEAYNLWQQTIKIAEVLIFIMAIGLIVAILEPFLKGVQVRGVGGASYQAASYYAVMCYGMIGLATFRLSKEYRLSIMRQRFVALINVAIMAALFVAVLINGGRGAFVLLAVYTTIIIYWIASKGGWTSNGVFRFIGVWFAAAVLLYTVLQVVLSDPILAAGWRRAVAFIGGADGSLIDLAGGSSGRDRVYLRTIHAIAESPLFGYGAFGHWDKIGQPHNLFLDLIVQFGIPGAISLQALVFITLLLKMRHLPRLQGEHLWLLVLFLHPIVNLLVSSGYLRSSLFWFCLTGLLFTMKAKKRPKISMDNIAGVN